MGTDPDGLWFSTDFTAGDIAVLTDAGVQFEQYVFFDTVDHMRTCPFNAEWSVIDAIQDAMHRSRAGPIGRIRILNTPFAALPRLQIVLEPAGIAPDWVVLPIDARGSSGVFCCVQAPFAATGFAHVYQATQACPAIPEAAHRLVARGLWHLHRGDGTDVQPMDASVLDRDATLILEPGRPDRTVVLGSSSSSTNMDTPSSSTTASSGEGPLDRSTPFCTFFRTVEQEEDIQVAFHAAGHHPWQWAFSKLVTPEMLAQHAARRLYDTTGHAAWKIIFMPSQPIVHGVHLHVLVVPIGSADKVFLFDTRRIFGHDIRNLHLLQADASDADARSGVVTAAYDCLLRVGLAEQNWSFHVTALSNAALAVPSMDGLTSAVEDTLHVISQLPGLRQFMMGYRATDIVVCTSTTTTTTSVVENDPFRFLLPTPRRTLARLGVPSSTTVGFIFETTLEGEGELHVVLHQLTQQAIAQNAMPAGYSIAASLTQPAARAAQRELLFFAVPPKPDPVFSFVWVDLRPAGSLSFLRVNRLAEPDEIAHRRLNVRALYANAHRWDGPRQMHDGDLVAASFARQAPDSRAPDTIAHSLYGMHAACIPLPLPTGINRRSHPALNLETDSIFHWESSISARLRSLGFSRGRTYFVVVGPGIAHTASVGTDRPTLEAVADWVETWLGGRVPPMRLYDARAQHKGRWVFVAVPGFNDPQDKFVAINTQLADLAAYLIPHGASPDEMACIAPFEQALQGRPRVGMAYYAPFWPPCDHEASVFLLLRDSPAHTSPSVFCGWLL